jgi:hypothetical protein
MFEANESLSPQGLARREEILRVTQRAARSRRVRRRVGRTLAGSSVAMLVFALWMSMNRVTHTPPSSPRQIVSPTSFPSSAPQFAIAEIPTDPQIADRLALKPASPKWTVISDDELLATLSQTGQPAGLITTGDETVLVPQQSPEQ